MEIFSDGQWWREPKERVHDALIALVDHIRKSPEEKSRIDAMLDHARIYSARWFRTLAPQAYAAIPRMPEDHLLNANVTRSVVDAATAKIAKNRPRAVLVTNGGDWFQKHRAKKATRAIEGAFQAVDLYETGPTVFRDAAIFGTGAVKWYAANKKITCDRVLPFELLVDPTDGYYGKPRCLYQTKIVDRDVLLARWGKRNSAIRAAIKAAAANGLPSSPFGSRSNVANPVEVVEAWRLPTSQEADDGLHVIAIAGATLLHEKWIREDFPFVFYRWSAPIAGFWGQGLVEEIRPIQREINKTLKRIQEILHLCAVPRILCQAGSVVKSMITNAVGGIIPYKGEPPTFAVPPSVPPELFVHLRWLIQQAFELTGVSQLSAQAKKPPGLDAAIALREYSDIETERFSIPARGYELWFMRGAKNVIACARDMERAGEDWAISHFDRRAKVATRLTWKDVAFDEEAYTLQVLPTSALPRDMAGRMATVEQMIGAGFISQERGRQLLDFPDLDAESDLALASMELVEKQVATMLDPDVDEVDAYQPPEPYSNLTYARLYAQLAHDRERIEGAPEERLSMLREYIDAATDLLEQAAAAEAAKAAGAQQPGAMAPVIPIASAAPAVGAAPVPVTQQAA